MTIKTVRRQKWHGKMKWQATDYDGLVVAFAVRPIMAKIYGVWIHGGTDCRHIVRGHTAATPRDWTSTLRRIGKGKAS